MFVTGDKTFIPGREKLGCLEAAVFRGEVSPLPPTRLNPDMLIVTNCVNFGERLILHCFTYQTPRFPKGFEQVRIHCALATAVLSSIKKIRRLSSQR